MAAYVAWLDASVEEERRARELLAMFRQKGSIDELGIGQIRDAFSDALFPGTSTLHTRARYFLLVPWLYRHGAQRERYSGPALRRWAERKEREHIAWLQQRTTEADERGLIGRQAGAAVKQLPSTVYWSGLVRYGILRRDVGPDQLRWVPAPRTDDGTEPSERPDADWVATLPTPPEGFPTQAPRTLALSRDEAEWLRERVLEAVPTSLLAHTVRAGRPYPGSTLPWRDSGCLGAGGPARGWLDHAELFSTALHGAALLFNLLVAERYEQAGLTAVEDRAVHYRQAWQDWVVDDLDGVRARLAAWDWADLWARLRSVNPRISVVTQAFVHEWVGSMLRVRDPDDRRLRDLVAHREHQVKQAQSRLHNDRLLRAWRGASGARPLDFRWGQARDMLVDIADGVGRVDALA